MTEPPADHKWSQAERTQEAVLAILADAPTDQAKCEMYVIVTCQALADDEQWSVADVEEFEDLVRAQLGLRPRPQG